MFLFVVFPLSWMQSKYLVTDTQPLPFHADGAEKIRLVSLSRPQPFAEKFALSVCVLWEAQVQDSSELEAECVTPGFTGAGKSVLSRWLTGSRTAVWWSRSPAFGAELIPAGIQILGRVCQGVLHREAFQRLVSSTTHQKMNVYGLHLGEAGQQCAWHKERTGVTTRSYSHKYLNMYKKLKLRTIARIIPPGINGLL